jgi:hypothetical protein
MLSPGTGSRSAGSQQWDSPPPPDRRAALRIGLAAAATGAAGVALVPRADAAAAPDRADAVIECMADLGTR